MKLAHQLTAALLATVCLRVSGVELPEGKLPAPAPAIVRDVAFDLDGQRIFALVSRDRACFLEIWKLPATSTGSFPMESCPASLQVISDGTLLLTGAGSPPHAPARWLTPEGMWIRDSDVIVTAISRQSYVRRVGLRLEWKTPSGVTTLPSGLTRPILLPKSMSVLGLLGDAIVVVDESGSVRPIATDLRDVESIAVSPDERDAIFSARRGNGHDVALTSLSTGKVDWIQSDPSDETAVTWAPRGNKVSYLVRGFSGPVLRTVHVPTGFQLPIDFRMRHISKVSWDLKAERFAVVSSSPSESDRIEVMNYNGEGMTRVRPPDKTVLIEPERLPEGAGEGVLVRPPTLLYNRRYPLVVWLATDDPIRWSSRRIEAWRESNRGMVVTRKANLTARFWEVLRALTWVDAASITIVSTEAVVRTEASALAALVPAVTILAPAPPGARASETRLGKRAKLILFRAGERDVVESEAARQLRKKGKGLSKRNGDR